MQGAGSCAAEQARLASSHTPHIQLHANTLPGRSRPAASGGQGGAHPAEGDGLGLAALQLVHSALAEHQRRRACGGHHPALRLLRLRAPRGAAPARRAAPSQGSELCRVTTVCKPSTSRCPARVRDPLLLDPRLTHSCSATWNAGRRMQRSLQRSAVCTAPRARRRAARPDRPGRAGAGAAPGGAPMTFCEPLYMASTPQASPKKGMPPSVQTVSMISSVPFAWHRSPRPARFWCVPVLLSPCRAGGPPREARAAAAAWSVHDLAARLSGVRLTRPSLRAPAPGRCSACGHKATRKACLHQYHAISISVLWHRGVYSTPAIRVGSIHSMDGKAAVLENMRCASTLCAL
jgi:hypothetical protein